MNMTTQDPPTLEVLQQSPILALRTLSLKETDTAVIISGQVASYYLKQLAQETLRPLLAGRQLVNQVQVDRDRVQSR